MSSHFKSRFRLDKYFEEDRPENGALPLFQPIPSMPNNSNEDSIFVPTSQSPETQAVYDKIVQRAYCNDMWSFEPECVAIIRLAMIKLIEDILAKVFKHRKRRGYKLSIETEVSDSALRKEDFVSKPEIFGIRDLWNGIKREPYLIPNNYWEHLFRERCLKAVSDLNVRELQEKKKKEAAALTENV